MKKLIFLLLGFSSFLVPQIFCLTIDDFENIDAWGTNCDGGASLKIYSSVGGYEDTNCMKFSYDLTDGNWTQTYKDFSVQNFSYGDTLKFWFYGSGDKNNLEVKLEDNDGSVFVKTLTGVTDNGRWTEIKIPFSEFSYGWGGDSFLDKTKIKKISFGVTKNQGGKGYIIIDDVVLYLSTPTIKVLDNFDDLNSKNLFGGDNYIWTYGGSLTNVYVSTQTYSGTGAVELNYDVINENAVSIFLLHLNGVDISDTLYVSFYLKGKDGGERFKLKFEDWEKLKKEWEFPEYIEATTDWQEILIPLSKFEGLVSSDTEKMKFSFVFNYSFGGVKKGTVYLDEIKFYVPGTAGSVVKTIDPMDEEINKLSSWMSFGDAVVKTESVNGKINNAVKLSYDFTFAKDSWAVMERNMNLNISQYTHICLKYKGQTNNNNFELKLTDADGTSYWKKIFNLQEKDTWHEIKIPIKEFSYFMKEKEDADKNLDLKNITKIYLVISKPSGSILKENKGVVYFDDLTACVVPEYETSKTYIEKFEVKNNPFSPNDDGIKDKVYFVYKLKDYSYVKLEIFNLRGEKVKVFNEGEKLPSEAFTIEWDGRDDNKQLLKNGLYIYRFSIKTLDGKEEEIKHIIGIVK